MTRKFLKPAVQLASVCVVLVAAASANAQAVSPCAIASSIKPAWHLKDLPLEIHADLLTGGRLADSGQPYYNLDAKPLYRYASLPVRRLARAGRSGENWFVWVQSYFPGFYDEVFGYQFQHGKWRRTASLRGAPCPAINAVLAGVKESFDTLPHPLTYKDARSNILFVVGRDGQHVTAIAQDGKILWDVDPLADAGLDPYRTNHPLIDSIGPTPTRLSAALPGTISVTYDSTQFGALRIADGKFKWLGQD
jgi:outer membrane protein assembly factor BamB